MANWIKCVRDTDVTVFINFDAASELKTTGAGGTAITLLVDSGTTIRVKETMEELAVLLRVNSI